MIQAWDFTPGSNFVGRIQRASTDAPLTIAVLTPAYLGSWWTEQEWTAAFRQETLLPVRVDQVSLDGLLGTIVYVDLVGLDEAAARERLLTAVQHGRLKPSAKPPFPHAHRSATAPRFPAGAPTTWSLPVLRNRHFAGREQELQAIERQLVASGAVALRGLGGVGKTQIALQHALRAASSYDVVWWIDAEREATLMRDYAALAMPLGLADDADERAVVEAVRAHLSVRDRWLLVFDNAPDPASLRPHLPTGDGGHVLITSRYAAWGGIAWTQPLGRLPGEDAARLLRTRSGDDDEQAARRLGDLLEGLPLALMQAAAYAEVTGRTLAEYIELFERRRASLLAWSEQLEPQARTVATTWDLAFVDVRERSSPAADLLTLLAFLGGREVPIELLTEEPLPEPLAPFADPLAFDAAIAVLGRSSLVERSAGTLSVHRLVQTVMRDRLDDAERRRWCATAIRLLVRRFAFDPSEPADWPQAARLISHVLTACDLAEELEVTPREVSRLLLLAGLYTGWQLAALRRAVELFDRALALACASYGDAHLQTARILSFQSQALAAANALPAARDASARALAIAEQIDEPGLLVGSLTSHGNVLRRLGDLAGAQHAFERALNVCEALTGPDDPDVAACLGNLGTVRHERGDTAAAKADFERALAIFERALGPTHPQTGTCLMSLGMSLRALGELHEAKAIIERALAIDEASYGPHHPHVASNLGNLANVLLQLDDVDGAKAAIERARTIDEATYGPEDPQVAGDLGILANVLMRLGDVTAARATYERALAINLAAYGEDHHAVAIDRANLAETLESTGDLAGARDLLEAARATFERTFGAEDSRSRSVTRSLIDVLERVGDERRLGELRGRVRGEGADPA